MRSSVCRVVLRSVRLPLAAFTLIELLIVVAIIAVLAAIAVPNFLEAQTRSKISRAKADMRSVATALEAYRVDGNHYPTMREPGFVHSIPCIGDYKWWYVPDQLSTPVAYITTADLRCPFGGDLPQQLNFPGEIWRRFSYENIPELEQRYLEGCSILEGKYGPTKQARYRIGQWRVLCIGPDNAWNPMIQYDPTNGTVSAGNIMRTQADPQGTGSEQRP